MLVRAFYPVEFAVVADGVLSHNNFCARAVLAHTLRMKPTDLRKVLTRMSNARLMRTEKRQQRRVNYKDERRPSHVIDTEFCYVPLTEMLDAFMYRVDKIEQDVERRLAEESVSDRYRCVKCGRIYALVDVVGNRDEETGSFFCDGMYIDRRTCYGSVVEEDNSSALKEVEAFKKRFDAELRPLRLLAATCAALKIPAHPLEGADEQTWAQYVPELVGVNGEVVDEEGLSKEMAAELNGTAMTAAAKEAADAAMKEIAKDAAGAEAAGAIPERPDWFKDAKQDPDEKDDDWEEEREGARVLTKQAFGTGNSFGEGSVSAKRYLQAMLSDDVPQVDEESNAKKARIEGDCIERPDAGAFDSRHPGRDLNEGEGNQGTPSVVGDIIHTDKAEADEDEVETPAADIEGPVVQVRGKKYSLHSITDDLIEKMTPAEFTDYCDIRQAEDGGDDDDDNDVEF